MINYFTDFLSIEKDLTINFTKIIFLMNEKFYRTKYFNAQMAVWSKAPPLPGFESRPG